MRCIVPVPGRRTILGVGTAHGKKLIWGSPLDIRGLAVVVTDACLQRRPSVDNIAVRGRCS